MMFKEKKLMLMPEAIQRYVKNGDALYLGGFIQHDPFAAAHEIIRQGKEDLTISKCAGMIIVDQLIGAGVVKHLTTSVTIQRIKIKSSKKRLDRVFLTKRNI